MKTFARLASRPATWRRALRAGRLLGFVPGFLRPRALRVWGENHVLPAWRGGAFRDWLKQRKNTAGPDPAESVAEEKRS